MFAADKETIIAQAYFMLKLVMAINNSAITVQLL